MTIALIATLTVGVAIAAWREWHHARRLADALEQKHRAQQAAKTAYQTGYEHGIEHTRRVADSEAESIRRNAYNRGVADATRQKVRAA